MKKTTMVVLIATLVSLATAVIMGTIDTSAAHKLSCLMLVEVICGLSYLILHEDEVIDVERKIHGMLMAIRHRD